MRDIKKAVEETESHRTVSFTVRADMKLFDEMNRFTAENNVTRSAFIRLAIRQTINRYKKDNK